MGILASNNITSQGHIDKDTHDAFKELSKALKQFERCKIPKSLMKAIKRHIFKRKNFCW